MQQLDYVSVFYPIVHPRTVAPVAQNALVFHHIKLLTCNRLFFAQGLYDITDAHFIRLKQLNNLQANRMGKRLEDLSHVFCHLLIHFKNPLNKLKCINI